MSDWISVKDRQPDHPGRYLCRVEIEIPSKIIHGTHICHYWKDDGWLRVKVTHWMPLPESPEEENE